MGRFVGVGRIVGVGSLAAALAFTAGCQTVLGQSDGDAILQASACQTLDWAGQAARFYADGGIEEEDDDWVSTWLRQLRMQEVSDEVLESRHGRPLRDYLDVVTRSLETQNIVAGDAAAAAPAWDDLVARGIEVWDEFGCGDRSPSPAGWLADCEELADVEGGVRETCLTPEERRELREEHERVIAELSEQLRDEGTADDD